jgi:hypothetical protein
MILIFYIKQSAPKGIRIPVAALKGRCPRPLDDGGYTLLIVAEIDPPVKSPALADPSLLTAPGTEDAKTVKHANLRVLRALDNGLPGWL